MTIKHAVHYSSQKTDWCSPDWLVNLLKEKAGITVDAASTPDNAVCDKRLSDGLAVEWIGVETFFCNPPYGKPETDVWVRRMHTQAKRHGARIIALLPARPDTTYWHDCIEGQSDVLFLRGRLKFKKAKHSAPFPSALVFWNAEFPYWAVKKELARIGKYGRVKK